MLVKKYKSSFKAEDEFLSISYFQQTHEPMVCLQLERIWSLLCICAPLFSQHTQL